MIPVGGCRHPEASHLDDGVAIWCPWCGDAPTADRALSLLAWLRAHGPTHLWAAARALEVRRKVVRDLARALRDAGRIEAVGAVRVRTIQGWVELTVWAARVRE